MIKKGVRERKEETEMNTELRMLVGFPGCGKSTYAREMEKKGYKWHSSDEIRKELGLTGQM